MTVLLALIVAVATLTPSDNLPSAPGSDKLHHFLAFGVVAFPAAFAKPRAFLWVMIVVSAYGAAIEIIQPYVGRHGDIMDALFNAAGAFLEPVLASLHGAVCFSGYGSKTGLCPVALMGRYTLSGATLLQLSKVCQYLAGR